MNRIATIFGFFLLVLLLGACDSGDKDYALPAGQHRVSVRLIATALDGLDAQYTFWRQEGSNPAEKLGAGLARNNATEEVDGGIKSSGDVIFVEISFRAITPTSTVTPNPAASYAVEILVDGAVKSRVVIDAASRLNNSFYLAAVAKTTL